VRGEAREAGPGRGAQLDIGELRVHSEGEAIVPTLPCPQLKPGVPLPSPEDLRGKILIKNKKNQFSGSTVPSKEPDGEAEDSCPPSAPSGEDTGKLARGGGWEVGSPGK
jgi:hypothetical protein